MGKSDPSMVDHEARLPVGPRSLRISTAAKVPQVCLSFAAAERCRSKLIAVKGRNVVLCLAAREGGSRSLRKRPNGHGRIRSFCRSRDLGQSDC